MVTKYINGHDDRGAWPRVGQIPFGLNTWYRRVCHQQEKNTFLQMQSNKAECFNVSFLASIIAIKIWPLPHIAVLWTWVSWMSSNQVFIIFLILPWKSWSKLCFLPCPRCAILVFELKLINSCIRQANPKPKKMNFAKHTSQLLSKSFRLRLNWASIICQLLLSLTYCAVRWH